MSGWFGFWAPKGTPKEVDRQAQRRDDAGARRPGGQGASSPSSGSTSRPREQQTPEGLAAFQKAEIEKWWPIIKAANIKGEVTRT